MIFHGRTATDQVKLRGASRVAMNPLASYRAPSHPMLHLQRIVGNQGIQRLMQAKRVDHLMDSRCLCAAKKPGEASYLGGAAKKAPQQSSRGIAGHGKDRVLRAPSSTSNDCGWLRAKCYYYCTKTYLFRLPPDTPEFSKCKRGCCDWAYNQCQKDGSWPCVFPGM
jgi:hypothetical protein